jgi:hypothetical protein
MALPPRYYHGLQAYQELQVPRPEPIEFVGLFEGNEDTFCVCPFDSSHKVPKRRLAHHVASKCQWRPKRPYRCRYSVSLHQFWSEEKHEKHEPQCIDNPALAIAADAAAAAADAANALPAVIPRTTPWVCANAASWNLPAPWVRGAYDGPK